MIEVSGARRNRSEFRADVLSHVAKVEFEFTDVVILAKSVRRCLTYC